MHKNIFTGIFVWLGILLLTGCGTSNEAPEPTELPGTAIVEEYSTVPYDTENTNKENIVTDEADGPEKKEIFENGFSDYSRLQKLLNEIKTQTD